VAVLAGAASGCGQRREQATADARCAGTGLSSTLVVQGGGGPRSGQLRHDAHGRRTECAGKDGVRWLLGVGYVVSFFSLSGFSALKTTAWGVWLSVALRQISQCTAR
jgi:hypothetical protein